MEKPMFKKGQKLKKNYDGRIVQISYVEKDYIELDGDFEPRHMVMMDKVLFYYSLQSN